MQIDKSDFIAFLTEFGSTILMAGSSFKGFFVPLQSSKQLLDVKLVPRDAVVYTDPAESLVLVSNSKIQYINGNPIYLELGLERFLPGLTVPGEYRIRTSSSLLLNSRYNIAEGLYALSVPASYDIAEQLYSVAVPASYEIPAPVPASLLLSAAYDILALPEISGLRTQFLAPSAIVLHWNAHEPGEVDHYEVHRATTPSFAPSAATLVGRPSPNSFRNRDLLDDVTYYFKVCTVDQKGNKGNFSSEISATTSGSKMVIRESSSMAPSFDVKNLKVYRCAFWNESDDHGGDIDLANESVSRRSSRTSLTT